MNKKELKKLHKDLEINLVDIISKFDPSDTNKYTKFLVDKFKSHLESIKSNGVKAKLRLVSANEDERLYQRPQTDTQVEDVLVDYLHEVFQPERLDALYKFDYHLKAGRIPVESRDISTIKSWTEIEMISSVATIKEKEKVLEKEVIKVYEDDTWLVIKPLSMEASLAYGSNTKWCTAMRNNKEYFYRYSKNGVLIYVLNKKTGDKWGSFYDIREGVLSWWNAPDERIDSLQTGIPFNILDIIRQSSINDVSNRWFFSEEELKKSERFNYEEKAMTVLEDQVVEMVPVEELAEYVDTDEDVEDSLPFPSHAEGEGLTITFTSPQWEDCTEATPINFREEA